MVPVSFAPSFEFCGLELRLVQGRALYWPREAALLVADLHLEKASYFAGHGQMLPPYDSRETLERLALAVRETGARRVFCLGDNFHDAAGSGRLEPHAAGMLAALTRALDWVWITGNHDSTRGTPVGTGVEQAEIGGLLLRHRASAGETRPELSGHFHPRLTVMARGRRIIRPCAVRSERRLILPAFGALTGGMDAGSPEILSAMQPASTINALASARGRIVEYPLWRAAG
ncbi:MAG: ligase-associated DNA damage response endonuclease PdeM [Novosphingobium sp.]